MAATGVRSRERERERERERDRWTDREEGAAAASDCRPPLPWLDMVVHLGPTPDHAGVCKKDDPPDSITI